MIKKLITDQVLKALDELVILDQCIEIPFCSLGLLEEIMKKQGVDVSEHDLETNGWQADFWTEYTYKDKIISVSGSMFYGNLSLTLTEILNKE